MQPTQAKSKPKWPTLPQLHVYVKPAVIEQVRVAAAREGHSVSAWLRALVIKRIRELEAAGTQK